ncbi:DUF427 domain-containing protein [Glaciibacter flavus]|uniref:DUF427 domain-containing protein n=1 Tax=Orlajensenia flava TaxID=2565934 RepID=A0A4S4FU02_9MICO|nr:DUF427 domain-containing protein [Glaciibacter flavus]THG34290.1 DUF427 domain-containing protein [Glaciibacter flavus]
MKAVLNGTVLAEADKDDLIQIEGNWYFPPSSVDTSKLEKSPTEYTCPWKGEAQYFNVVDGGTTVQDQAWSYPHPKEGSPERVGQDFADYVAFWKDVSVEE